MYHLITIREDLDAITSILYQVFVIPSFKIDYDTAFGKIPQDQWKIKDPVFIKQSEVFAITKFKEWIMEQIT